MTLKKVSAMSIFKNLKPHSDTGWIMGMAKWDQGHLRVWTMGGLDI